MSTRGSTAALSGLRYRAEADARRLPFRLVDAVPNGLTVEYMPRLFRLFDEVPVPQNGELAMRAAPGLGLIFNKETIRRFGVA
jgi:hypothetical protein